MNVIVAKASDRADYLALAKDLAGVFEGEAAAVEANKTLTPAVIAALSDSGLFWMGVPGVLGGGDATFVELLEVIEEITRADGSTGWSFMANALDIALCGAMLGDRAIDAMFGGGRRPIMAGMLGPNGKCVAVEGGYQAGGTFAFGSGGVHADWIGGGMLVMEDGKPRMLPEGVPEVQICFVPKSAVEMLGNWNVTGMAGTGSVDYRILDQFVHEDFAFERRSLTARRGAAHFSGGVQAITSVGHAGVALGLMKRALQEVAEIAGNKKRIGQSGVMADSEQFRYGFGLHEAAFQAARTLLFDLSRRCDEASAAGEVLSPELRARHRQLTTWLHKAGDDIVRFCHLWSGSEVIRADTAMSRVSRDWAVIIQHLWVDPVTITDTAPLLLESWRRLRS